jgi:adenosine kinase
MGLSCTKCLPTMRRLLVTGSLAYDYILEYPGLLQESLGQLHEQEQSRIFFHTEQMAKFFGGCGGNVAYTLGLLGEAPRLLAIAGYDAKDYFAHLEAVGVDCSCLERIDDESTATCLIINDDAQNRFVAFHGGVVDRAAELSVKDAVCDDIVGCIITPDDVPAMVKFARECRELKLPFYFDFGSQVTWLTGEQLREGLTSARAAFCNEYEFSVLQKKTGWSLDDLLKHVPVMVITQGGEGCRVHQRGEDDVQIPACPIQDGGVDPSGAGDAFRAGFGFGRVRDWPVLTSAHLASTAAAFALEARGTQGHYLDRESLLERCQAVFGPIPSRLIQAL